MANRCYRCEKDMDGKGGVIRASNSRADKEWEICAGCLSAFLGWIHNWN